MDNHIIPFVYDDQAIRVIKDESGEPWWVARDICRALELENVNRAVKNIDDDEKGVTKVNTPGGEQNVITINEPGLYNLIFRSNKPEAKIFKRWITHEVIPSIRKTGKYHAPGADDGPGLSDNGKKSTNMYFPMAKLVESADKYLEGRAALHALNYFTGMPVDDLLVELEEKQESSAAGWNVRSMAEDSARTRELVSEFMAECCEFGEDYTVGASALYHHFYEWCQGREATPVLSQKKFGKAVSTGFLKQKQGTVKYYGIRLKSSGQKKRNMDKMRANFGLYHKK